MKPIATALLIGAAAASGIVGLAARVSGTGVANSCPKGLPGAELIFIPGDGKSFCIDAHEVKQREYAEFVDATQDSPPEQSAECAQNDRFVPVFPFYDTAPQGACLGGGRYEPDQLGEYSMGCADWCDAKAYCEWAGKRLCGSLDGKETDLDGRLDPKRSEWAYACTSAGAGNYPYGKERVEGKCLERVEPERLTFAGVEGTQTCKGAAPPFDRITDLVGGVAEWTSACDERGNCARQGGDFSLGTAACDNVSTSGRFTSHPTIGVRCCADATVEEGL
jgi:formylglycine-generating enzyme required for sulfatase activity